MTARDKLEDPPLFTVSGEDSQRLGVFLALKCFVLSIPKGQKSPADARKCCLNTQENQVP